MKLQITFTDLDHTTVEEVTEHGHYIQKSRVLTIL